jgi:Tol biopolymer transport system component
MPSLLRSKLLVALVATTALLALPTAAGATLVYVKNPMHPAVFAANDNGDGAFKVGSGSSPKVSPDGDVIAYAREGKRDKRQLMISAAAGGGSAPVLNNLQESFYVAFSPDSKLIAAIRGPELGKRSLVLIDVTSGTVQRTVATGFFSGVSFSPDGSELAFSMSASENYPPRSDVYTAAIGGGTPVRITSDHRSVDPLWGPNGRIVFVKQLAGKNRKNGPKNDLFLMSPLGKQVKRLTHTKVGQLTQGLYPTEWSESGNRLLAEFEGQDTSYAVTVDPKTGAEKVLDRANNGEQGFVGTALSKDGTAVLGFTGGFEPGPNHRVATFPYGGGKAKTLVKGAYEPDWSR